MTEGQQGPWRIPAPPDFPFEWEDPADAERLWRQSRQHSPLPYFPFSGWIAQNFQGPGASSGFQAAGVSINIAVKRINTYRYGSISPAPPLDQMEEAERRGDETLERAVREFVSRWEEEWLPELKGYHAQWESFDLSGATDSQLSEHFEWTLKTFQRLWHIHFEVTVGYLSAPSMFVDLYEDLFGVDEALEAFKLLQGIENITLRSGRELWDLAQTATAENVRSVIVTQPTNEVIAALADSDDGSAFLSRLDRYIETWGARSNMVEEFGEPSWTEDPATIIENLKNYLDDNAVDPGVQWDELVAERERLTADVRTRLSTYPEPVRQRFEELLVSGQQGQRLQEDHNWWIDQRGTHTIRQVVLEIGRRIAAARVIEDSKDVFYLDGDEIRATMRALVAGQVSGDLKVVVGERRADMDRWRNVRPPQALGIDPGPPPENATSRAIGRFFGGPPPAQDQERPDVLKGIAGSPGKTSGVARVILHLGDAGRLQRGDILVTATTNPPWTPLFATAGGIVTDTGGPLSHCAIVAREYGLPAVVGTGTGTEFIKDGQMVEVDGDAGEVRVLQDGCSTSG